MADIRRFLPYAAEVLGRLPVGRKRIPGKPSFSEIYNQVRGEGDVEEPAPVERPRSMSPPPSGISTEDTIAYQDREIGKSLLLFQRHLTQKCKIDDVACGCCEKHPMEIEALAEETLSMTDKPIYNELIHWTKKITPMTTEEASASGDYDQEYLRLAEEARELRLKLIGTENIGALLTSDEKRAVAEKATAQLNQGLQDE